MRIHSDSLAQYQLMEALRAEIRAGRIAPQVRLTLTTHGSRSHARAFEIHLTASYRNGADGRRVPAWGGANDNGDAYGATYDEWGWFLAALYSIDPEMVCGNVKRPAYADRADFDHKTGLTYNPKRLLNYLEGRISSHGFTIGDGSSEAFDPYPYASRVKPQVGRHGYNRTDGEHAPRWSLSTPEQPTVSYWKWAPRNAADYRAFAHLPANETIGA